MKKRMTKKIAKNFVMTGRVNKRYGHVEEEYFQAYTDGRPPVYKILFVPNSKKLRNAIIEIAYRMGWDGCHWDSPFLLEVDDTDLREWEEERG